MKWKEWEITRVNYLSEIGIGQLHQFFENIFAKLEKALGLCRMYFLWNLFMCASVEEGTYRFNNNISYS